MNKKIIENTNKNEIVKCVGYDRVSTTEQRDDGLSLDVQRTKIIEKIQEIGGELAEEIYTDGGISGTSMNRPGLQEMLARCTQGDINYLVVQDSSRIARNTYEYLYIKQLLGKYNVRIIPLTGMVVEENNPLSDAMDELIAVVNSIQPKLTSYKVKQTAREKFRSGIYPSCAPAGYLNVENPNASGSYDRRIIIPDKNTAPFIAEAFKRFATGDHSIFSITEYLRKNGMKGKLGKELQYSAVYKILTNPFYYGLMRWKGEEKMGKHKSLIDKSTFDIVQRILSEKQDYSIRRRKHTFLLSGFAVCENCGRRYVAEWHHSPKFKARDGKIGYYHCSGLGKRGTGCNEKYIHLEDLETQIEQEVERLHFRPDFIEAVKNNIEQVYKESSSRTKSAKKALNNKKVALEEKKDKLDEEFLEGTFDRETYKRLSAKIVNELLQIQKELLEIEKIKTIDTRIVDEVLNLTNNVSHAYKDADISRKKAYLHFFFKEFAIRDTKVVEVKYQPVINVLKEAESVILRSSWLPRVDSNHEPAG